MASPGFSTMDTPFLDSHFNLPSPLSTSPSCPSENHGGWNVPDHPLQSSPDTRVARKNSAVKKRRTSEQEKLLACTSCRQKKIKCQRENDSCKRCRKMKLQCITPDGDGRKIPSSKSHVWMLQQRIQMLERELQKNGLEVPLPAETSNTTATPFQDAQKIEEFSPASLDTTEEGASPSLISRICTRKPQLHTDEVGRLHFFGPTSSLHTTENTSSWFVRWGEPPTTLHHHETQLVDEIPLRLQEYLLDRYWKYQHTVIQVVHKEAFLHDMRNRQYRYYSKALLYSMFACGARIAEFPELRALVLSKDGNRGSDDMPLLLNKATILVEEELRDNAGITTVQSLQLLSVIYCCTYASDNKGWMDSGRAIRLAFELGLHHDVSELQSTNLSQMDLEVRRVVFWGCYALDRMWALYLGRPYSIRLEDVTVPRATMNHDAHPWDMLMSEAWTGLLTVVGRICDVLNQKQQIPSISLNEQLQSWSSNLSPSIQYSTSAPPSVFVLHMQYHSALILTQRPAASFGTTISSSTPLSLRARKTCVESAIHLAAITQDYRDNHGSASTMLGTSLYNITIAVIVLIANWADGGVDDPHSPSPSTSESEYLAHIESCMLSLKEMETSYIVARTLSKQLSYLMRRCNFPSLPTLQRASSITSESDLDPQLQHKNDEVLFQLGHTLPLSPESDQNGAWGQDGDDFNFMLMMSECDALRSVGPWSYPMDHPIL